MYAVSVSSSGELEQEPCSQVKPEPAMTRTAAESLAMSSSDGSACTEASKEEEDVILDRRDNLGGVMEEQSQDRSNLTQLLRVEGRARKVEARILVHLPSLKLASTLARMGKETARSAAVLGLLTFASIWGTLARMGLVALNTYRGQSVDPVVWAQGVACLIMGWCIANKDELVRW